MFKTTWKSFEEKAQTLTEVSDEPSLVEISPKFDVASMLQSMTKGDAMNILGFDGYDVEGDEEMQCLDEISAFENDEADAIDRLEEAVNKATSDFSLNENSDGQAPHKATGQSDSNLNSDFGNQNPDKVAVAAQQ